METSSKTNSIYPFSCSETGCNKAYRSVNALNQHITKNHSKAPPKFVCRDEGCGKKFHYMSELKAHQKTHGREFVISMCAEPGCDKSFSSPFRLKQHERLHKGTAFHCGYCLKEFTNQSDLKKHERIHSGEKPFKCKECGQAFKVAHHLREHERKHTDDRPHACHVKDCTAKYRRADALKKHMASRHPDIRTDEDLVSFLSVLGIKTISDMLKHDSLRKAIDELRPSGMDMLAELAATSDICRCDPCFCDPNKPNSLCNCIVDGEDAAKEVTEKEKSKGCCSKGKCCGKDKAMQETSSDVAKGKDSSGGCCGKQKVNNLPTAEGRNPLVDTNENCCVSPTEKNCCGNSVRYDSATSDTLNFQVVSSASKEKRATFSGRNQQHDVASGIFGSKSIPLVRVDVEKQLIPDLELVPSSVLSPVSEIDQFFENENSLEPMEVDRNSTKEIATQYEDPTDFADFDLNLLRSPDEKGTDAWDLSVPSAHKQGQTNPRLFSPLLTIPEPEIPLDLTTKSGRDQGCDVLTLDASMLPSPVVATRISDHEELNGMCSDGIQTTCCTSELCTKPGILGLCNKECDILDSGCGEPYDGSGSCALKPGGCAEKNCCDKSSKCGDLKKHENTNCCIVVCLNDLENNLPQGTITPTSEI